MIEEEYVGRTGVWFPNLEYLSPNKPEWKGLLTPFLRAQICWAQRAHALATGKKPNPFFKPDKGCPKEPFEALVHYYRLAGGEETELSAPCFTMGNKALINYGQKSS